MKQMNPIIYCFLVLALLCGYKVVYAEVALAKIKAVDSTGSGVIGNVLMFKGNSSDGEFLDETDETGIVTFEPPVICKRNYRIIIMPENIMRYEQTQRKRCKNIMQYSIKLRGVSGNVLAVSDAKDIDIVFTLIDRAKELSKEGDYGSSVLVYTELAERLRTEQPIAARNVASLIPISVAKKLKVQNAVYIDPDTNMLLMSVELKQAVKDYQRTNGIEESGKLDNETVVKMAGKPNWVYLYKSPVVKSGLVLRPVIHNIKKEKNILNNLAKNIEQLENTNNYSLAAMLSTEYAARLRKLPKDIQADIPLSALESEIKSYQLLGKYLKVNEPVKYDPVQDRKVVSGRMGKALKDYQVKNSLQPTGKSSYATLNKMSGENVSSYLYKIISQEVTQ